jgi:succinoglycan biosynthesis protein ExoA
LSVAAPSRTKVSVLVPMRNEIGAIADLMADIARQDYEGEVEILVADGGSTDGSVEALAESADRLGLDVRLLPNPGRSVSYGLNACIGAASGDLFVRMDCHASYPPEYLRSCAELSAATGAANVGGVVVPRGRTATERGVACAMDSPFGGIGWTRLASSSNPVPVDTVTFGAFRREAFERTGLFEETLLRNQDDEFNLRLRRAGEKILLDPAIRVYYTPRASLALLFRQYYEYGLWKVPVMRKHRRVLSGRSLAPLGLVASLALLGVAAPINVKARRLLALETALYGASAVAFGLSSVRRRGEEMQLLPRVIAAFPTLHLAYGLGMACGLVRGARD